MVFHFPYHIALYLFLQSLRKMRFFPPNVEVDIIATAWEVDALESESIAILLNFLLRLVFALGTKFSFTESLSMLLTLFKFGKCAKRFVWLVSSLSDWYFETLALFGIRIPSQTEDELSSECWFILKAAAKMYINHSMYFITASHVTLILEDYMQLIFDFFMLQKLISTKIILIIIPTVCLGRGKLQLTIA